LPAAIAGGAARGTIGLGFFAESHLLRMQFYRKSDLGKGLYFLCPGASYKNSPY